MSSFLPFSVAVVTPFDADGEFRPQDVGPLVAHLVAAGAPALLISGSTGEQHCLTIDERCSLYQLARDAAGPDVAIYVGVAAMKSKHAIALAQAAAGCAVDGIMLGFTPYSKITQLDAEQYVQAVAGAASGTPIFLYNNSGRQPFDLAPESFVRILASCPNVQGVKEVVKHVVPQFRDAVAAAGSDIAQRDELVYFSGSDANFIEQYTLHSFTGLTSVVGQIFTREMQQIVESLRAGDTAAAKKTFEGIAPGVALLSEGGRLLQSIKHVLRGRGVPAGYCCLPLQPLTAAQAAVLDRHFGDVDTAKCCV